MTQPRLILISSALALSALAGCGAHETAGCFPTILWACPADQTPVVPKTVEPAPVADPAPADPAPVAEAAPEPAPEPTPPPDPNRAWSHKLASGTELFGAAEGIEKQLVEFLDNAEAKPDKDTWFNFDRLTFAEGAADLDMDASSDQLNNLKEILNAYPNVKIKVGGYTDNTGKAAANKKLSTARAKNVKDALVGLGVDKKRLESEGYGDKHAVCPANDSDECKAQNRRIAIRVLKK